MECECKCIVTTGGMGSAFPAPSPALRERVGVRALASGESKWGQIKIQEHPLFGARNAPTKFCSDPFCALCGAPAPASLPERHPHRLRSARQQTDYLEIHALIK